MTNYMGMDRLDKFGRPIKVGHRVALSHENRLRVGVVVEIDARGTPIMAKLFLSGDVLKRVALGELVVAQHQENLHE